MSLPITALPEASTEVEAEHIDPLLAKILGTRRCHNSPGEQQFRQWLAGYLQKFPGTRRILNDNYVFVTDDKSDTLFSCHIDTVHSMQESHATSKQALNFDANFQLIGLDDKHATCLGADDGAGIYIMLKMIEAEVPGTFVFHVGEEKGGLGAKQLAANQEPWLRDNFSRAIAFDRPGDSEIIITQGGLQCASPEFAAALRIELAKHELDMKASIKGVYTDVKEYAHVIPECVNLGVGYYDQHTNGETLDYRHLKKLLAAAIAIKWDELKPVRKPVPKPVFRPSLQTQDVIGSVRTGQPFTYPPATPGPTFHRQPAKKGTAKPILTQMAGWNFEDFEDFCLTQETGVVATHLAFLYAEYVGNNAKREVLKKTLTQG